MQNLRHKFVGTPQGGPQGLCRVCGLAWNDLVHQDPVHHPPHYGGDTPHEIVKCLAAWGLEFDALLWNAVKYIARHGKKGNALEDLQKARFYLDRRIKQMEEDKANGPT